MKPKIIVKLETQCGNSCMGGVPYPGQRLGAILPSPDGVKGDQLAGEGPQQVGRPASIEADWGSRSGRDFGRLAGWGGTAGDSWICLAQSAQS